MTDPTDPTTAVVFREALAALKLDVLAAARHAVGRFEQTTGMTPTHLDIEMLDVSLNDRELRSYVVDRVRVRFDDL